MRYGLHPLGDDLSCSRGLNEVIPTEKCAGMHVSVRNHLVTGIDDSCGNDILVVAVTVGIATLNPRLNMDYPLSGIDCMSALHVWAGDLPVAPTATRCNPGVFY